MPTRLWRHADGALPNLLALTYAVLGYVLGWVGLFADSPWINALATLWLAHAMVIAAYLIHECAHNTVFADNRRNARLGAALGWLCGAAYGRYEDLRRKHMRHHVERADVIAFDHRHWLRHRPRLLRLVLGLEWLYLPALDLLMHLLVLLLPFSLPSRRPHRARVVVVLALRGALLLAVAWFSIKTLLLYVLAYLLFLHVLRFMDVHQHTYTMRHSLEAPPEPPGPGRDRHYEQRNTYSNLISRRWPWLNLLTLNFGYHNAHHERPTAPWYALPRLHEALHGTEGAGGPSFGALLHSYHRHRVARVLNADPPDLDVGDGRDFVGVLGVSFLTAH